MPNTPHPLHLSRRRFLTAGSGTVLISTLPATAWTSSEDAVAAQRKMFGDADIQTGRVTLKLPPIAENGYSVPLSIDVESPMTPDDYVKRIAVFAERNPLPNVAEFMLGPRAGYARVKTRIRMGGTQTITAIAEMNDGALWLGTAHTVVTLAACVVL